MEVICVDKASISQTVAFLSLYEAECVFLCSNLMKLGPVPRENEPYSGLYATLNSNGDIHGVICLCNAYVYHSFIAYHNTVELYSFKLTPKTIILD